MYSYFRVVWTWGLSSSSSSFSGWCGCGGLAEQTRKFHHPQSSKRETKVTQDIYVSKSDELSGFPLEIQELYFLLLTKKFNIITILKAARPSLQPDHTNNPTPPNKFKFMVDFSKSCITQVHEPCKKEFSEVWKTK